MSSLIDQAPQIEKKIGYSFHDKTLLALAFVHRSFVNEHREISQHNERLEFLGDSVLGMLIAEHLYKKLPNHPEGELSLLRSRLVEASACVTYLQHLDVSEYILLGKGERMNDGRGRESIHADLFEALIGAIYLDGGLIAAQNFLFKNFSTEINAIIKKPLRNWKALLQDYCQRLFQVTPVYTVLETSGPDHSKLFKISVSIDAQTFGYGEGASKKEAQQSAAEDALRKAAPESLNNE